MFLFLACGVSAQGLLWWWGALLLPLRDFTSDIIWLKFSNYQCCTHYTHLSDILNFALSHHVGFLPSHSFEIFSRYSLRLMLINFASKINNPLINYSSLNNSLGFRQMSHVSHNVFPPLWEEYCSQCHIQKHQIISWILRNEYIFGN